MKRMKNGKAVGPDDIPVEVWKCLGESALEFLTKLYNITMGSERMPEEWRDSVLIPIFKNKGGVQSCSNYRDIKLIAHTMKLWERVAERRLRSELTFSEQQYGVMSEKGTTDALLALRVLMEKYREGQNVLHCRPGAIPNPESESKDESESESGFDSGFGFMCSGIGFGVGIV